MKRFYFFCGIILGFLMISTSLSQSDATIFQQAMHEMQHAHYDKAAALFEQLPHKNCGIFVALAQCCVAQKKYAQALLFCQRGYRSYPTHGQIERLIDLEQRSLEKAHLKVPDWYYFLFMKILILMPTVLLQFLLILCLLIILLMVYRLFFVSLQKKWMIVGVIVASFVGILWYAQSKILKNNCAFVVKENVIMYAGPDKDFHKISQLKIGTQVDVLGMHKNMSKIKMRKQCGWVVSSELEVV